jgi:molybdate transport system substrate-binding protein
VKFLIVLLIFASNSTLTLAQVRIACSSNFFYPLSSWKEKRSNELEKVEIVPGATSNLYHQIEHGAPFQVFICSDPMVSALLKKLPNWERSEILAYGYLVFWSKTRMEPNSLRQKDFSKIQLAISDPNSTPFGRMARDYLKFIGSELPRGCILGDGVQQVNQFIYSGSLDAAFTSNSLIPKKNEIGGFVLEFDDQTLPQEIHLLSTDEESIKIFDELISELSDQNWKEFHYLIE